MKKEKTNNTGILFLIFPLTALALYIMLTVSGFNNSDGVPFTRYTDNYPLVILGEYTLITVLFIPFIIKAKADSKLNFYILPLMLFSALGMMRIDADTMITSSEANRSPAIMFIILFTSLTVMAFSRHTAAGIAGTLAGTAFFPAFGLSFAPFITAAAFLIKDKNKKEKTVSVLLNSLVTLAAAIYSVIKLEITEVSFSKKYIPAIFLSAVLFIFFTAKKEYKLIPLAALPLFPLITGILFGTFSTPLFTLAACVAPLVIIIGTASTAGGNEKLKGYAQKLVHNPAVYIITAVFILHTACSVFVNPGYFRDAYI